jgi:lysophospholipase L1-like esterase
VLLQVLACEAVARVLFLWVPRLEKTRRLLRGELEFEPTFQYSVGQAYLLYVPTPNYKNDSGLQHNAHGYRGKALPQARTPGVARILCLGGSTTYGWGAWDSDQTYPAHLERLLTAQPPAGFKAVEVLNAGLPYGTTAEMLTHYHFKFHFYDPDLVILNPGGNDAQGLISPYYHPDYSHWRQPLVPPQQVAPRARRLLQSRLVALFLVPLLYDPYPDSKFVNFEGRPPMAPWYDKALPNPERRLLDIPKQDIAFSHNLDLLVDEILKDGHKLLLVPFRLNPRTDYGPGMMAAVKQEEQLLRDLATSRQLPFAPFLADIISPENWLDACCHVNGRGNLEKANHLLPFARRALETLSNPERTGQWPPAAAAAPSS